MRIVQFLLLTCAVGSATTLTNSSFGSGDPNVVGSALSFDTQSISVSFNSSTDTVTAVIDLDFDDGAAAIKTSGGSQYLASFTETSLGTFYIGDLFFYDPGSPTVSSCAGVNASLGFSMGSSQCVSVPAASSLLYAVVLDGSDGTASDPDSYNTNLTTGDVYSIGGGVSTQNAFNAYGSGLGTGVTYRPGQVVDLTSTSTTASTAALAASGIEKVCAAGAAGCTTNGAQYQVTVTFSGADFSAAFLSLITNGQIGLEFSATDCGNAVLSNATPEPGTVGMIATGIGMLGLGLARRRRKS